MEPQSVATHARPSETEGLLTKALSALDLLRASVDKIGQAAPIDNLSISGSTNVTKRIQICRYGPRNVDR
ncbi:hypothetical protein RvY_16231 [Ramazzottius varieornatus]|uniref:Uncharacterized protein n=1 Tax=Ramazzottius varieornatus TaxID=947166 RepID=A0A1D1VXQ4_RAMVA|nr:hypothetical protein RvY_16231 [Ramazzottius varieornatus]